MYRIKTPALFSDKQKAGQAIQELAKTVFVKGPPGTPTEWEKFEADPGAWLYALGYRLEAPDAPADGSFDPAILRLAPIYDSPHLMHVRVPYAGNIDPTIEPPTVAEYGTDFNAFLASYFTRQCR
jgi:hypothetical protein